MFKAVFLMSMVGESLISDEIHVTLRHMYRMISVVLIVPVTLGSFSNSKSDGSCTSADGGPRRGRS